MEPTHSQHKIELIAHLYVQSLFLKFVNTNLCVSSSFTLEHRVYQIRVAIILQHFKSLTFCLEPDKFFIINNRQNLRNYLLILKILNICI